jgi:ferredoxin--NADP+ reductase
VTEALRVAVIGSGPAGIYACETLVKAGATVDVFDALPAPYGLVRYGVAPDHLKIKSVARTLCRVLESPGVRFIGNVAYGTDLRLDELRRCYDATVFATGSPHDRRLGIAGEDLPGSVAAADVVNWYSALPGATASGLDATDVAIIGAGNVALDVARILAKGAAALDFTDMPDDVLETLGKAGATDIHIVARRGPAQAKFTLVELREMGELPDADVVVDPADLQLDDASREAMAARRTTRTMVELFEKWSRQPLTGKPRRVHFHFLAKPVALIGSDRVQTLQVERQQLDGSGGVRGLGELQVIPAQLVVRSIGYRGRPIPGLPFDESAGTVPNEAGRVDHDGNYVAGWIKRGPTGVIGTNRSDAAETVATLLSDADTLPRAPERAPDAILRVLADRGVDYVTWDGWLKLDQHELELGRARGRERTKLAELAEMLKIGRLG